MNIDIAGNTILWSTDTIAPQSIVILTNATIYVISALASPI